MAGTTQMGREESIPQPHYCGGVGVGLQESTLHVALTMDFGLYFGLEGSSQTVPRSEMFAIIVLCLLVAPHAHMSVGSESAMCVTSIANKQRSGGNWMCGTDIGPLSTKNK